MVPRRFNVVHMLGHLDDGHGDAADRNDDRRDGSVAGSSGRSESLLAVEASPNVAASRYTNVMSGTRARREALSLRP